MLLTKENYEKEIKRHAKVFMELHSEEFSLVISDYPNESGETIFDNCSEWGFEGLLNGYVFDNWETILKIFDSPREPFASIYILELCTHKETDYNLLKEYEPQKMIIEQAKLSVANDIWFTIKKIIIKQIDGEKFKKGEITTESFGVLMHDLENLDIKHDKSNFYHYRLLKQNLRDIFGIKETKNE